MLSERDKLLNSKKAELRKLEDDMVRARKDMERQTAQMKETAAASTAAHRHHSEDDEFANMQVRIVVCLLSLVLKQLMTATSQMLDV